MAPQQSLVFATKAVARLVGRRPGAPHHHHNRNVFPAARRRLCGVVPEKQRQHSETRRPLGIATTRCLSTTPTGTTTTDTPKATDADLFAPGPANQVTRKARDVANRRAIKNARQLKKDALPVAVLPNLTLAESLDSLASVPEAFRASAGPPAIEPMSIADLTTDPLVRVRSLFFEDDDDDANPSDDDASDASPTTTQAGRMKALPWRVFREPLRLDVLNRYVKWQRANWRPVHRAAKGRSEKRGSSRKIQPQKGLGKARMGTNRSPLRRGGGKAHGPTARDWQQSMNKQERRHAIRVVLSQKLREKRLHVVDAFDMPSFSPQRSPPRKADVPRSRDLARALENKGWSDCLLVRARDDVDEEKKTTKQGGEKTWIAARDDCTEAFFLSARNLATADLVDQLSVTVFRALQREHMVFTPRAIEQLWDRVAPRPPVQWRSVAEVLGGHTLVSFPPSATLRPGARGAASRQDDIDDDDAEAEEEEEDAGTPEEDRASAAAAATTTP